MEPEVGELAHQVQLVARFRGEHGFGRLLADLLQHGVLVGPEQARDVGGLGVGAAAGFDHRGDTLQRLGQSLLHASL
jgi:hypothetical protein